MLAQNDSPDSFDAIAFDGGALVRLVNTTTLNQYAADAVILYILKQLERSTCVDVVWAIYLSDNIKASTREKRAKGIRQKVAGKNKLT